MDFNIFSLNCWDVRFFAKYRKERLFAIVQHILENDYDVVCLQEIRSREDYNLVKDELSCVLPSAHYFFSGVIGSGVCIFTKHDILEVLFHPWCSHGYLHSLSNGDWFSGKGIGLCKISCGEYIANIYCAHLISEHEKCQPPSTYPAHRIVSAHAAAHFVALTSDSADVAILAGDLSCQPDDLLYRILICIPNMRDSFAEMDVQEDLVATYQRPDNTFSSFSETSGARVDYIIYKTKPGVCASIKNYILPLQSSVPGTEFSYSNHSAIAASFIISQGNDTRCSCGYPITKKRIFDEGIEACNDALKTIESNQLLHMLLYVIVLMYFFVLLFTEIECNFPLLVEFFDWIMTTLMIYCALVVLIFNKTEKSVLSAGKSAMEVDLENTRKEAERKIRKLNRPEQHLCAASLG